jgi:hypothetical protein
MKPYCGSGGIAYCIQLHDPTIFLARRKPLDTHLIGNWVCPQSQAEHIEERNPGIEQRSSRP